MSRWLLRQFSNKQKVLLICSTVFYSLLGAVNSCFCYPQFQDFAEHNSGRTVNCALCHSNSDGPTGDGPGQVGGLSTQELKRLDNARTALDPGKNVDNPLLNRFGNEIIRKLGRTKFIQLMSNPKHLAAELGNQSDLDGDGIPDAVEYLDGTDPLNKFHGDPVRLLLINLKKFKLHVLVATLAIFCLSYGFRHLLIFLAIAKAKEES
jgi:hypothetical protein